MLIQTMLIQTSGQVLHWIFPQSWPSSSYDPGGHGWGSPEILGQKNPFGHSFGSITPWDEALIPLCCSSNLHKWRQNKIISLTTLFPPTSLKSSLYTIHHYHHFLHPCNYYHHDNNHTHQCHSLSVTTSCHVVTPYLGVISFKLTDCNNTFVGMVNILIDQVSAGNIHLDMVQVSNYLFGIYDLSNTRNLCKRSLRW